jgi:hypothetical protein
MARRSGNLTALKIWIFRGRIFVGERGQTKTAVHQLRTQLLPTAHSMCRFSLSPVDALIDLVVVCRHRPRSRCAVNQRTTGSIKVNA